MGSVDGSHIPIRTPFGEDVGPYICRKGFPSIILQGLVDSDLRFLNTNIGWPGSVHDARVLRNSPVFPLCNHDHGALGDYIILADSAYPNLPHLIPPFRDSADITPEKLRFNKLHNACRSTVERAFGRFQALKYGIMASPDFAPVLIQACCILHNLLECDDTFEFESATEPSDDLEDEYPEEMEIVHDDLPSRRDELLLYLAKR